MTTPEAEIAELMKREVTDKLHLPSIIFGLIALFVVFKPLGCVEYELWLQVTGVMIVILSLLRFRLFFRFKKQETIDESDWTQLLVLGWGNAIGWTIITAFATIEHQFAGPHYMVVIGLVCGFVSASLVTLSSQLSLFLPFVLLLLGSQVVLLGNEFLTGDTEGVGALFPIFTLYLAYQIKQVFELRARQIKLFIQQIELKASNEEIKRSHLAQKEQGLKLVHTSRMASLGAMAASISHEVNNPLGVISGNLQVLRKRISEQTLDHKEDFLDHLNRSLKSIDRIQKITEGLQQLSHQSDHRPKENCSVQNLIGDTLSFCSELLKSRAIEMKIDAIPDVYLFCHPVQLSQVLINLIKNAADAIAAAAPSDRWIQLTFSQEEELLIIRVSNGGNPIPEIVRKNLFRPYFTTKEQGKGTGLGLSISREIMHDHDGDLSLLNDTSNTTFVVKVPIIRN